MESGGLGKEGPLSHDDNPDSGRGIAFVNVLCICGAIIGTMAMFGEWGVRTVGLDVYSSDSRIFFLSGALYLVGSLISFVTPLAAPLQASGLALFWHDWLGARQYSDGWPSVEYNLGVGFYMGVASVILVALSIIVPAGPGLESGKLSLRRRLLVFRRAGARHPSHRTSKDSRIRVCRFAFTRSQAHWVVFPILILVLSTMLASVDSATIGEDSLKPIPGGVIQEWDGRVLQVSYADLGPHWGRLLVTLNDSHAMVYWNLTMHGLDGGIPASIALETRHLGNLNVTLVATDVVGNGIFDPGDSIAILSNNSSWFPVNEVFEFSVISWRIPPIYSFSWRFVFHENGDFDHWQVSHGYLL